MDSDHRDGCGKRNDSLSGTISWRGRRTPVPRAVHSAPVPNALESGFEGYLCKPPIESRRCHGSADRGPGCPRHVTPAGHGNEGFARFQPGDDPLANFGTAPRRSQRAGPSFGGCTAAIIENSQKTTAITSSMLLPRPHSPRFYPARTARASALPFPAGQGLR